MADYKLAVIAGDGVGPETLLENGATERVDCLDRDVDVFGDERRRQGDPAPPQGQRATQPVDGQSHTRRLGEYGDSHPAQMCEGCQAILRSRGEFGSDLLDDQGVERQQVDVRAPGGARVEIHRELLQFTQPSITAQAAKLLDEAFR